LGPKVEPHGWAHRLGPSIGPVRWAQILDPMDGPKDWAPKRSAPSHLARIVLCFLLHRLCVDMLHATCYEAPWFPRSTTHPTTHATCYMVHAACPAKRSKSTHATCSMAPQGSKVSKLRMLHATRLQGFREQRPTPLGSTISQPRPLPTRTRLLISRCATLCITCNGFG